MYVFIGGISQHSFAADVISAREVVELKPFQLRVMSPGSVQDVLDDFYSDTAMGAISIGDLLDLPQTSHPAAPPLLRVIGVEHELCSNYRGGFSHFVRVFTEEVPDTCEVRLARHRCLIDQIENHNCVSGAPTVKDTRSPDDNNFPSGGHPIKV